MSKKTVSLKDYERLGRILESVFAAGYADKVRLIKMNFFRGVAFGFGSVVGGTIVIALLAWVLSFFNEIPFLDKLTSLLENSVRE